MQDRASAAKVHLRVVRALLQREMTTRYGRSAGGYLWAVGEPLGMIAMLSLVFALISRTPALGESFVVFFASGYLSFHFYRSTADVVGGAISFNKPLMKYPAVNAFDAILARFVLQVLTNCLTATLILSGSIHITGENVQLDLGKIAAAVAAAAALGLGIGSMNAVLFQIYPTWQRVWNIANRPLFIISGIFYIPEEMPRIVQEALFYNPVVHVVSAFRSGIYPTYRPILAELTYPLAIALATFFLGLLLLRRFDAAIADN
jgi:capsular polysaccharide transport system permease protein